MALDIFPNIDITDAMADPLSIQAFGKRFVTDQSLYEYLLEFLLIFSSAKKDEGEPLCFKFHEMSDPSQEVSYYTNPRIALKRFIFFERSKKEGQFLGDEIAYNAHIEKIKSIIKNESQNSDCIEEIQDLLYGFSLVLKNRSWFAQSCLPISSSIIFCESMGEKKNRDQEIDKEEFERFDQKFQWSRHNFLARGGEVYYLHILQSLMLFPEYTEDIELGLKRLINQNDQLTQLADIIQNSWQNTWSNGTVLKKCECGYIPKGYEGRSKYTCCELSNFLNTAINGISKIDILAKGMILQIMRMVHIQAKVRANKQDASYWIIDMKSGNKSVRKWAEISYSQYNEDIIAALQVGLENYDAIHERLVLLKKKQKFINDKQRLVSELLKDGRDDSYKVMKKLGKEIKFIIPANGDHERFSLSEDNIKFLVLSLIEPGSKVTIEHFMDLLFEHYGMVIGRKHMHIYCKSTNIDENTTAYFKDNEIAFKQFLNNCGFLRDLSDATSIVYNPYEREN